MRRTVGLSLVFALLLLALPSRANAFAYTGSYFFNESDRVVHQMGYTGAGASLTITIGIDPSSPNAAAMVIPTRNVVSVWNNLTPTTGNLTSGVANDEADFESVLLHEMGHALGLGHPNIGSQGGLTGDDTNYTASTQVSGGWDLDPGGDGVIGSADDIRGDDVNLNWFRISNNNPFSIADSGDPDYPVDSTSYSVNLADLPGSDNYSTNPDRTVAIDIFGLPDTESVLQQQAFYGETQRTLGHDDVAGILYSFSGFDEIAGTADDYTYNLVYAGLDAGADIVLNFDNGATFASTSVVTTTVGDPLKNHYRVSSAPIHFNTGFNWHFNAVLIPESSTLAMLAGGLLGLLVFARRKRRQA